MVGTECTAKTDQPAGRPSTTGRCINRKASMMLSPVTRLPTALPTLTPIAVSLPGNISTMMQGCSCSGKAP